MKIYDGRMFTETFAEAEMQTIFDLTPHGAGFVGASYNDHLLASDDPEHQVRRNIRAQSDRELPTSMSERSSLIIYELTAPGNQRLA